MMRQSHPPRAAGRPEAGFTLIELVVAMAVFGMIGLGIFGVLVLGARSAGSGERISEQGRRFRVANEVITRQIASVEPIQLPPMDDGGLDDEGVEAQPFFYGDVETLAFVTTAPQRPDASGMAIVNYWLEDGALKMSERPVFSAYGTGEGLGRAEIDDAVETILLYDVESVTFSYQRESDTDEWLEVWDAVEEEMLPAVVRIDVRPAAVGGPDFYHEIPIMVGLFNQIADADGDFRRRSARRINTPRRAAAEEEEEDDDESPGATLPDDDDE